MALDEAILESVAAGQAPPTLRMFAWEPPCLSLGYAQPATQVDPHRLRSMRWDLVRRPTGGRAILHVDELTYSVAAPAAEPAVSGGVLPSYRRLSEGLVAGLRLLGLEVETHPEAAATDLERANPVCFEVPSPYEITVRGKKLVGSAQLRRRGGVLQHGSLPLGGDIARVCQALVVEDEEARLQAAQRMRGRAATVEDLLGVPVAWSRAADCLVAGFSQALSLTLEPGMPTDRETARAQALARDRYLDPRWTERV